MKHKTASEYLRENNENLQLPSDPAPSSLLLQGGRVSSHSSSEGVLAAQKVREKERK